jgi:hypothetical protein
MYIGSNPETGGDSRFDTRHDLQVRVQVPVLAVVQVPGASRQICQLQDYF